MQMSVQLPVARAAEAARLCPAADIPTLSRLRVLDWISSVSLLSISHDSWGCERQETQLKLAKGKKREGERGDLLAQVPRSSGHSWIQELKQCRGALFSPL